MRKEAHRAGLVPCRRGIGGTLAGVVRLGPESLVHLTLKDLSPSSNLIP